MSLAKRAREAHRDQKEKKREKKSRRETDCLTGLLEECLDHLPDRSLLTWSDQSDRMEYPFEGGVFFCGAISESYQALYYDHPRLIGRRRIDNLAVLGAVLESIERPEPRNRFCWVDEDEWREIDPNEIIAVYSSVSHLGVIVTLVERCGQ